MREILMIMKIGVGSSKIWHEVEMNALLSIPPPNHFTK
jgi:hypothetical protein